MLGRSAATVALLNSRDSRKAIMKWIRHREFKISLLIADGGRTSDLTQTPILTQAQPVSESFPKTGNTFQRRSALENAQFCIIRQSAEERIGLRFPVHQATFADRQAFLHGSDVCVFVAQQVPQFVQDDGPEIDVSCRLAVG